MRFQDSPLRHPDKVGPVVGHGDGPLSGTRSLAVVIVVVALAEVVFALALPWERYVPIDDSQWLFWGACHWRDSAV